MVRTQIIQIGLATAALGAGAAAFAADVADAVMRGDAAGARSLLEQRADVNEPQADGATALHWAVYHEDLDTARLLVEAGADPNASNRLGATPMFLASVNGNEAVIELLLEAGTDANETFRNGETPLMFAARTGSVPAIPALLAHGAEIDARENLRGTTALMWAAAYRNAPAVAALVEHGADVGAKSDPIARGRRPYLAPSARARIDAFHRGEGQAGASIRVDLDGADDTGFTLGRVGEDQAEAPRSLAPRPPSVDGPRPTPGPRSDDDDTTSAFFRQAPRDSGGLTPLVFAAREGDMASARVLVEAGADVNQVTEYGWTPLLTATQNRFYVLGEYLLEQGADPNIANKGGWTPLYIATDNRNIEGGDYPTRRPDMDHLAYIELVLEHGADPSIPTDDSVTPLMVASGIGWVEGVTYEWSREQTYEVAKMLIEELGADVNARDTLDGRTALMGAAHKGHAELVELLVDHGADLAARDIGSRDSIHKLAGVTWQAIDYADGLVRVGVQSAIAHPETAALLRRLMEEQSLPVPPEGRTLDSICIVDICR